MESMKTEQQRIAIAKACGWSLDYIKHHAMYYVPYKDIHIGDPINDLNAIHEAEKIFDHALYCRYIDELCTQAIKGNNSMYLAPAAQRAEAFLRAIGKWVES